MNRSVTFVVPGKPVPQGSHKPVRMGARLGVQPVNKAELADYRARVAMAAQNALAGADLLHDGPLQLAATFYIQRPQAHFRTGKRAGELKDGAPRFCTKTPDTSKLVRALEDGMTGVVYRDDSLIVRYSLIEKMYARPGSGPSTLVTVREL